MHQLRRDAAAFQARGAPDGPQKVGEVAFGMLSVMSDCELSLHEAVGVGFDNWNYASASDSF